MNKLDQSLAHGREELGAVKNRPSLLLESTADSCAMQMGFESHCEENCFPVAHVRGCREDKCCFIAPAPLFTHRDLLASFSVCQHLLTTPEQGHRVADAPWRRRHLLTQQRLCSSS